MSKRKANTRVRNLATGATCGHHHHTRESALRCLERIGWSPDECIIEEFDDNQNRKRSMHHRGGKQKGTREEVYRPVPL